MTMNEAAKRVDITGFETQLRQVGFPGTTPLSKLTLDKTAFYDFAFYEYLFPTETPPRIPQVDNIDASGLSYDGSLYLYSIESARVPIETVDAIASVLLLFENAARRADWAFFNLGLRDSDTFFRFFYESPATTSLIQQGLKLRRIGIIPIAIESLMYDAIIAWSEGAVAGLNGNSFDEFLMIFERILKERMDIDAPLEYDFQVYPSKSVNIGIRLVYRQEWKPLGSQPGEILKTIPLGPGQKERVTTKIIRREKRTSTMESATETESTTETTDSTKDSSEVVNEAASTFNWNVAAEVEGDFAIVSAKVSSSLGGTNEDKSKNTSSRLSESMRKAASKTRRQSKVVVTTESESTFEQETFSEISNPNNETAITFEYHKLQQQYEVFTRLAEVQSVVFVAERLPGPSEINADWVRKYDWIIAKVLRDESFRTTLNELMQDTDDVDPLDGAQVNPYYTMLNKAATNFATFSQPGAAQGQGLTIPDIFSEPQRQYQQHLQEKAARLKANMVRDIKRRRLFRHIRDNILHYCHAIWQNENHEQRILRYRKEGYRVPIEFEARNLIFPTEPEAYRPFGQTAYVWEVIDPTGPIAFLGNYTVYVMRPLAKTSADAMVITSIEGPKLVPVTRAKLSYVMNLLRLPYLGDSQICNGIYAGKLLDPALKEFILQAAGDYGSLSDEEVWDLASYLPRLEGKLFQADQHGRFVRDPLGRPMTLRGQNGKLTNPPTDCEYGEYLYRKNNTRRFLVDSNNLYLNIRPSEGAALEPYKRASRYIDVLKTAAEVDASNLKNERRAMHMADSDAYDPDIEKVIIVSDASTNGLAAAHSEAHRAVTVASDGEPPPVPGLE